jgi:polyisoprenoid-binding protein YceI
VRKHLLLALALVSLARAANLDPAASKITIHVEKAGLFSAFAHNHIVSAPLASGNLDADKRAIQLKFRTQDIKILDPDAGESERSKIQSTMQSPQVLDPARFPEIAFASTSVERTTANHYVVHGELSLHGTTRPIEMPVSFSSGHYTGKVTLKQTDFGITPVKIAGGAVRVKDLVQIEFDIVPAK